MTGARVALAVLRKDLLLDLRSRDRLGHMAFFAFVTVALLSITLPRATPGGEIDAWIPPLVWVVFLFTSLLGLARSFQSEVERGAVAILALAPCDRGWVFLGKGAANLIALVGVQVLTAVLFEVFLSVPWERALLAVAGVALLGAVGLAAVGTLLSAMSVAARFREFLLPILLFPLILPVLVIASHLTQELLAGRKPSTFWWGTLGLYDWIFILVGYFVFDYVLED